MEAFGIDGRLIVVQIINFFILLAALTYFLYKPMLRILQDREDTIKKGLADAEAARTDRTQADEQKQAVIRAAHQEAEQIHNKAKEQAQERADAIVATAEARSQEILTDAEATRERVKASAQEESQEQIAKAAVLAAERIIRERKNSTDASTTA